MARIPVLIRSDKNNINVLNFTLSNLFFTL